MRNAELENRLVLPNSAFRIPNSAFMHRRQLLKLTAGGSLASSAWLTSLSRVLARQEDTAPRGTPAQSVIVLWMAGGPSQLETFDPQPGRKIAAGSQAIATAVPGIQLAAGMERIAAQMESISLVRSIVSKEGDHERGTQLVKTGYRPEGSISYPSIGAVCCHELSADGIDIPRHVSILPSQWPARGGYLGDQFDAFQAGDPLKKLPDIASPVPEKRLRQRLADLDVLERSFARGREQPVERTLHRQSVVSAHRMMTSEQLRAFEISEESAELRAAYGHTPFGRGCLAARRLTAVGVRCVEVTLTGWDSHVNNHEIHDKQKAVLDPALAALVQDLKTRGQLASTLVLCAGEFGRTPSVNRLGGRDHWPHGFSVALAGGGLLGGKVIGATDPEGGKTVEDPRQVADVHATILAALGIDPRKECSSPVGRPVKLSEGKPVGELLG